MRKGELRPTAKYRLGEQRVAVKCLERPRRKGNEIRRDKAYVGGKRRDEGQIINGMGGQ